METLKGKIYIAVPGFEDHLFKELQNDYELLSRTEHNTDSLFSGSPIIVYSESNNIVFWHENIWLSPMKIMFDSISDAAKALRSLGRNWAPCLFTQFRRAALIQEKLPPLPKKKQSFPWLLPQAPMGAYTLLDANTMIASPLCSSPFPGAIPPFTEDKENPPSRAYLKLWEALTLCHAWPEAGERCLDAGASPGGWSWVLAKLGTKVIAVDRSPLEKRIADMKEVQFIKHDAFTLKPEDIGKIDWLFCDVACYPPRLYQWIEKWLSLGLCDNFVCTIKMQGQAETIDFHTPKRFAEIPNSQVVHLYHNKHELTWIKLKTV